MTALAWSTTSSSFLHAGCLYTSFSSLHCRGSGLSNVQMSLMFRTFFNIFLFSLNEIQILYPTSSLWCYCLAYLWSYSLLWLLFLLQLDVSFYPKRFLLSGVAHAVHWMCSRMCPSWRRLVSLFIFAYLIFLMDCQGLTCIFVVVCPSRTKDSEEFLTWRLSCLLLCLRT